MNMSSSFLKLLLGLSLCVMFTECMPKNENLITDAPDYQEDEAEVNNTTHLTEDGENDYYDTDATEDDKIDEMDGHDENGEFVVVRRTHACTCTPIIASARAPAQPQIRAMCVRAKRRRTLID